MAQAIPGNVWSPGFSRQRVPLAPGSAHCEILDKTAS
jgi:hypothetical protein